MASATRISVALDWTPNTIHTGLYVALEKGFYSQAGLDVKLLPPDESYTTTPARRLEAGDVDLAVCPSESCIAYRESGKMHLQAIYAILQKDASAIVSTKPEFTKVAALEQGVYGSYNAKYEDSIVRAMVNADGGNGSKMKIKNTVEKLSLFEETKKGKVDATWIFLPWEGIEAEADETKMNIFRTEDYGVPYGYSPIIARDASSTRISEEEMKNFAIATRKGYEFAIQRPDEAVEILRKHCQPPRSADFLQKSQRAITDFYGDAANLGMMDDQKWSTWIGWLRSQKLLQSASVQSSDLYTNDFLG